MKVTKNELCHLIHSVKLMTMRKSRSKTVWNHLCVLSVYSTFWFILLSILQLTKALNWKPRSKLCIYSSFHFYVSPQGLQSAQESGQYHANKNTEKDVVSPEAKMILRSRLKNEYILYDFVLNRLNLQYEQCSVNYYYWEETMNFE